MAHPTTTYPQGDRSEDAGETLAGVGERLHFNELLREIPTIERLL